MSRYRAIEWARTAKHVMRADGRPDTTARLVLFALASHAAADGTDAYPSIATLSEETGYAYGPVNSALGRLEEAGLIAKDGVSEWETIRWRLSVDEDYGNAVKTPREEARLRKAEQARARQAKRRAKLREERVTQSGSVTRHAVGVRDSAENLQRHAVGERDVTQSESVTHAVPVRDVTQSAGEESSLTPNHPLEEALHQDRSTGRYALPSGGPADAGGVIEVDELEHEGEDDGLGWAEAIADADSSEVVGSKDGEDERLAAEPVSEVADGPEMDQFMRDALEAEKEQQARYAAAEAASPAVPAAPQAQMLTMAEGVAEAQRIIRASGSHAFDWWTPNQIEGYLRHPNEPRAAAQLRKAKLQHLPARISA